MNLYSNPTWVIPTIDQLAATMQQLQILATEVGEATQAYTDALNNNTSSKRDGGLDERSSPSLDSLFGDLTDAVDAFQCTLVLLCISTDMKKWLLSQKLSRSELPLMRVW
jgi:hypothetical protein